jgi:myo-inositol catabolism protein IolC
MADKERTVEEEREADVEVESTTDREDEVVLDVDAVEDETDLAERVREQEERIEELEDLLLDLSVRVADDQAMGVCPDCHGAVTKMSRWIRPSTIECRRCGRVFHTY